VIDGAGSRTQSIGRDFESERRLMLGMAPSKNSWVSVIRFHLLWIATVFATLCLPAVAAQAQQLSVTDFAPKAAPTARGWWSLERTASTAVAPHLQLANRFETSPPVRPTTQPNGSSIVTPSGVELGLDTRSPEFSSFAEGQLQSSRLFLAVLEAKCAQWESSLADNRSLAKVNGESVYPLVQIDYAQARLPITLYIPPLRGSDAR
jgi:hypothetical protein